jgi:hypothetical protein
MKSPGGINRGDRRCIIVGIHVGHGWSGVAGKIFPRQLAGCGGGSMVGRFCADPERITQPWLRPRSPWRTGRLFPSMPC